MKKLSAAILIALATFAGSAAAGWTHKVSVYAPPVRASARGVATVTVETPADFTLSSELAPKLSVVAPEGITITNVQRAPKVSGKPSATSAAFVIAFTSAKKGRHTLSANVDFALCTAHSCTPKTERLSFDVAVE